MVTKFNLFENKNEITYYIIYDYIKNLKILELEKYVKSGGKLKFKGMPSLLITAIEYNNIKALKLLLESGEFNKNDINYKNWRGETLLILTARINSYKMVEILLKNGAEPNLQNENGNTALMSAKSLEVIILLAGVTDWKIKDNLGYDFIEITSQKILSKIKKIYPEKWYEYQRYKNLDKFNI